MTKRDAKALLKQSGKSPAEIKSIYDKHTNPLGFSFSNSQWANAIGTALAEAVGIPAAFSLKGPSVDAIANLMDQD
jgi:hypothetical protein